RILFHSRVHLGAGAEEANKNAEAERKDRKYQAHVYEGFPIRIWDRWLDETKMHLFVQDAQPGAEAEDLLAGTKLAAEPGFSPPSLQSADFGAVWAPDGKSIVFAATTNRHEAAFAEVHTHLFQIPAGGGEPKRLTAPGGSYSSPAFRPDGKALYATYVPATQWVYNLDRLVVFSWPKPNKPRILTSNWDRSVGSFAFSPDSRSVYMLAREAGHTKPFRINANGGQVEPVIEVKLGAYAGLAIPSKSPKTTLLASWQSSTSPSEVVRIERSKGGHANLTNFNKRTLAAIDWEPERHFWFTAADGRKVHNMLALPPNFDESEKYPLVIFMHGGPHSMSSDGFHLRWNVQMLASPGYVVLRTNYKGSTGFGEKFAQSIQGDPLRGPGDDINRAVDEAIERYPFIDASRIAAGGASYGGHLSNWLQATTTRYKCLYSHAGLISLEGQWATSDVIHHRERNNGGPYWEAGGVWQDQSPFRYAKNFQTPALVTVGVNDFRVPLNQTLAYWSVLQRRQVTSKLVWTLRF
ncbi:MAG: S9 family peptidase, partial [bacterium]|nr:S9 family peptidase [bacterium]